MKSTILALLALLTTGMAHAEPAFTVRPSDLQTQAQSDSATLASLPENTRLDVLRRLGAWSEVKTAAGQTGWVRMLNLRFDKNATQDSGAAGSLKALSGLLSTGRTTHSATVTTGVRGLTEEDLKNARANPAELRKMQAFAADKAMAEAFAQRTKLSSASLEYLKEAAVVTAPDNIDGLR